MSDLDGSFAIFDAVAAVFDKCLTHERWKVEAEDYCDWTGPARAALAEALETQILIRWDGNPAAAETDFEDLRDSRSGRRLNVARAEDGVECKWRGCDCDCHGGEGAA